MAHTAESLQMAFRYLFKEEVPALKQLAQSLPPNPVVVNLGAGSGTSGLAFMESRPDLYLYTVDVQKDDSPFGCLVAEENILREAGFWGDRYTHIQGDSKEIGKRWASDKVLLAPPGYTGPQLFLHPDLVFVDGDHSYEGCAGDIQAWLPNIKPGGIIAVHDYKKHLLKYDETTCPHPRPWEGVDRAVDELLLRRYDCVLYVQSLIAFRVE